jgi:signal transduction histidine kinase
MAAPNLLLLRFADFLRARKDAIVEDSIGPARIEAAPEEPPDRAKIKPFPWRERLKDLVEQTADYLLNMAAVAEGGETKPPPENAPEPPGADRIRCLLTEGATVRNAFLRALNRFQAEQANVKGFTALEMSETRQETLQEFDRLITAALADWITGGGKQRAAGPSEALREVHSGMKGVLGILRLALEKVPSGSRVHMSAAIQQLGRVVAEFEEAAGFAPTHEPEKAAALASAPVKRPQEPLRVAPLDLATFIKTVSDSFRPAAAKKGLRFEGRCGPIAQTVHTDAAKLHRAVSLLLDHSISFTDSGSINFNAAMHTSAVYSLTIRDSSPGIPPEVLSKVLLGLNHVPDESHGIGKAVLGSALARDLVEILGGVLEAESKAGEGTQFRILLPLS